MFCHHLVVCRSSVGIRQNIVGLRNLMEFSLSKSSVNSVFIRMPFKCKFLIRVFNLSESGILVYSKNFIIILDWLARDSLFFGHFRFLLSLHLLKMIIMLDSLISGFIAWSFFLAILIPTNLFFNTNHISLKCWFLTFFFSFLKGDDILIQKWKSVFRDVSRKVAWLILIKFNL